LRIPEIGYTVAVGSYFTFSRSFPMHAALYLLQSQPPDAEAVQKMMLAIMSILPVLILIGLAIIIVPTWFICKKAGFSPWLSFLCLVPTVGLLILLYLLAFAEWPSQRAGVPANWGAQPPLS
jgi:hypothetical protein